MEKKTFISKTEKYSNFSPFGPTFNPNGQHNRSMQLSSTMTVELCNIRSMYPKLDFISAHLKANNHIDLMFFTESWLSTKITDSMLYIDNFSVMRADRVYSGGGGVALLYNNKCKVKQVFCSLPSNVYSNNFEYLCVDYFVKNSAIRLLCFYLPPKFSSCIETIKVMCQIICQLTVHNKPCFILGDFNLPKINWDIPSSHGGPAHDEFLKFCVTENWFQQVCSPTHKKLNILDLVLCNYPGENLLRSCSVDEPLTTDCDHNLITLKINAETTHTLYNTQQPDFKRADFNKISLELQNIEWQTLTNPSEFQKYYTEFTSTLSDIIKQNVPQIKQSKKPHKLPKHIKRILNEKRTLYRKYKFNKSLKQIYKQKALQYEAAIRDWTNKIESKICQNPSSKKFYNYINRKLKTKSTIPPLINKSNNQFCFSDHEKASLLNSCFQNVFNLDDGTMPPISLKCTNIMPDFEITPEDITTAMNSMKSKITRTPEGIPSFFIKKILPYIMFPLLQIFNACIKFSYVPNEWKISLIVPIFKNGDKSDPANHRPIALTSSFSRLFEAIIHTKITNHLLTHSLLSPSQYGFLQNRSTCTQLITCVHEWLFSICNGSPVSVVYTDIAKAFDTVSHIKLIAIIESFGINPQVTRWLKNFLNNRLQAVCIGTSTSSFLPVHSGIPQGSVIGPLLFLLFFNDVTTSVNSTFGTRGIKLFADDAKLFDTDPATLQLSLNQFTSWLGSHQLNIAKDKCFSLSLTKPNASHTPPTLLINNSPIVNKPSIKDLGIFISSDLKWHNHVSYIYNKAYLCSYQILKCFRTKNIAILLNLYKTYVRPKLEYNAPVWSPWLLKDKNKIESVQRNFTKFALSRCNIKFNSYSNRLSILGIKSLEHRRLIHDAVLLYKIVCGLCCINFSDYFAFCNVSYSLRRNSKQIRSLHRNKTKSQNQHWHNNFFNRVVPLWNDLPDDVVTSPSLPIFKIKIHTVNLANYLTIMD